MDSSLSKIRDCSGGLKNISCRGLSSQIDHYTFPSCSSLPYSSAAPLAEKWACMRILPYLKRPLGNHQSETIFIQYNPDWTTMPYCPWYRTLLSPGDHTGTVFSPTTPSHTHRNCSDSPSLPHRLKCLVWPVRDRSDRCCRATPPCSRTLPSAPESRCLWPVPLGGCCRVRQKPLPIFDRGWRLSESWGQYEGDWHRRRC